jgi:large conductance mechanosensitive channel
VWGEFQKFVRRGNVIDMAVGIAVGTAFTGVVKSLVDDLIMPPIGLLVGYVDFGNLYLVLRPGDPSPPYATLADAAAAGAVTLRYGQFANAVLSFFIVALAVFLLVKAANRVMPEPKPGPAPAVRLCPHCATEIPIAAERCPHCTSLLAEPTGRAAYGPSRGAGRWGQ